MNVVEVHEKLQCIESEYSDEILKMLLFDFNVWPVLRRKFSFGKLPSNKSEGATALPSVNWIGALFKCSLRKRGSALIITTSASYNSVVDSYKYNHRAQFIRKMMGNAVIVFGQVRQEESEEYKQGKLDPLIDVPLNGIIHIRNQFAGLICSYPLKKFTQNHQVSLKKMGVSREESERMLSKVLMDYLLYRFVFQIIKPKNVTILSSSYGSEGIIMAAKAMKIPFAEYQHAPIFHEHPGYNFSGALAEGKKSMLVPDKILTFGSFWSEVLMQQKFYTPQDVMVIGNESIHGALQSDMPGIIKKVKTEGKTAVLVCSQPASSEMLRKYCENYLSLAKNAEKTFFVVKLHPRECDAQIQKWRALQSNYEGYLAVSDLNTHQLMAHVDAHLTRQSSTIYEALYFGLGSYVIPREGYGMEKIKLWELPFLKQIKEGSIDLLKPIKLDENLESVGREMWDLPQWGISGKLF